MRSQPPESSGGLGLFAFIALVAEVFLGVLFYFAPSWANGLPGGLSIYQVWSAAMTTVKFAVLITIETLAGSLTSLTLCCIGGATKHARHVFCLWIAVLSVAPVTVSFWGYRKNYALIPEPDAR
jgi:hypothetical protein